MVNKILSGKKFNSLLWIPGLLLLMGCLQDIDFKNTEISQPTPEISLPVVNTSLTLSDLIDADTIDYLQEGEDNAYRLYFNTGTQSASLNDYLPKIPDQNYSDSYTAPGDDIIAGQPVNIEETIKIPFEYNEGHLKQINFQSGDIYLEFNAEHEYDIEIDITFPNSKDENGDPISINNITIPASTGGTETVTRNIGLSGAEMNFVEDNGERKLTVDVQLSSTSSSSDSYIDFTVGVQDIEFESIVGYFNNINIPVSPDTFDIPFFTNIKDADLTLNPFLRIHILNSFGIPVTADFSNFQLKNNDTTVTLQDEGTGDFFGSTTFPYPENLDDPPEEKTYHINRETSNIEDAFGFTPNKFTYDLDFVVGSETDSTHFIKSDSKIEASAELEIPLQGSIKNLTLVDTSSFDISDFNELESLKVVLKTENGFPINVNLQIKFMDESYNIIRGENGEPVKLFDTNANILQAATIANEETGETTNTITDEPITATLDSAKLKKIKNAKYMLMQGVLNTPQEGQQEIKLYSFYDLKLHMALKAKPSKQVAD